MLTPTQTAEILRHAADACRGFVQEFATVLNPARTDWDAVAFAEARHTLDWIDILAAPDAQTAWALYQATLVAETRRLVAWDWRVFPGDETRQVDGQSGHAAQRDAWYAEPKEYDGDVLYSLPFATRAAAEAWADDQPADDERDEA